MQSVLVAEDDRLNQLVLCEMLKMVAPTASITLADNGEQALSLIHCHPFDLILTDISMPERDGLSLLKAVREELALSTPVVCITAFAVSGEREKLLAEGFDDYLSKPLDMTCLREIVGRYN